MTYFDISSFILIKLYWKDNFKSLTLKEGFTCLPILHHPLSRGEVRLKSGHIEDQPAIRPNYFSNRTDVDTLIKGIKVCLQLGEAPTLKRDVGAKLFVKRDTVCGEKFKVKLHKNWYMSMVHKHEHKHKHAA